MEEAPVVEPEPKTRVKKCSNGKHIDRVMRGGKRLQCTVCGDEFPCAHECDHFDCKWERDEPGAVIVGELGHGNL